MRIVDASVAAVPIRSSMRNAVVSFRDMDVTAVALISDVVRDGRPLVGYGFTSNGRYAVNGPVRDRFLPRLLSADPGALSDDDGVSIDPVRAWTVMMGPEKPGGHGDRAHAVGVLDMALWDLAAKAVGRPLYRLLADRFHEGEADERVLVYAAGGYYEPGKDLDGLKAEFRGYLNAGFTTVKMKIGGEPLSQDLERIDAVLEVVGPPDRLAVDANARFDLATALAYGAALDPYGLRWFEEPVDPLDYLSLAALAERYLGPLATGENLFSTIDAANLIRYGGLRPDRDILQFDMCLSYGITAYLDTLEMLDAHGWDRRRCMPHGGHQMALHAAAGLGLGGNELYPKVFEPFGLLPEETSVQDGSVVPTEAPGIGLELIGPLYEVLEALHT